MDAPRGALASSEPSAPNGASTTADRYGKAPPRYQPLIIVVVSVAAGIVADRYAQKLHAGDALAGVSWFSFWWFLSAIALTGWCIAWRAHRSALAVWLLLFATAGAAAAWHHTQWSLFGIHTGARYAAYYPSPVCVEAMARESPQRISAPESTPLRAIQGGERSRLIVQLHRVRDGTSWRPASGECQFLVDGHLLAVQAGDRLRIFGQFARINPPFNPGEFDFAAHARADGQLVRLRSSAPECVTVLAAGRWRADRLLSSIRDAANRLVRQWVGPDRAGLASAILLGSSGGLTAEETEPYLLTGTIHVLVVSGMNVAILAAGLYLLMRVGWLPRRAGLAAIMTVVVAYAIVAEFQPPVARAALFAVLACIGAWTGRNGVVFNSLAATALIVLAMNPADLFRAGPQLSFLAVSALIWIGMRRSLIRSDPQDPLDQLIAAARPWYVRSIIWCGRTIGSFVLASLVVWVVTLPLLLSQFHIASPVSVLISPILWVVVFAAMWSGFLMLALGWLIPVVGVWCGAVCAASLGGLEQLVAWAERLPAGHFFAPGPAAWWVIVFYVALLTGMIRGRAFAPLRWQVAVLCAWIVVGLIPPLVRHAQRDALECSFIAVGHGACVLMESPSGEVLLYDAGSLGSPEYATQSIASYLWNRGILRIDGIVISHADIDHYNAVPGLLERFTVGTVYVSPMMFDGIDDRQTRGPEVLLKAIRAANVPIREIWSGDQLRLDPDTVLHVIHPPRQGVLGSDNANSLTLSVEHAGRRMLLPGDLETPGIEDVMAELPYDCDVLLAPHHGSRRSDPPGFAAWSTPNWVVISGSGRDDVRPVVQTYERAGANVLQTNQTGAVHFSFNDGSIKIASWLTKPRD
jgi:competence protein ComEC